MGTTTAAGSWLANPLLWFGLIVALAATALYLVLRGGREEIDPDAVEAPTPPGLRNRAAAGAAVGVALVAIGAYAAIAYAVIASLLPFGAGFALLMFTSRSVGRHRHESGAARRVAAFVDGAMNGSLLAGVLVIANVAAFQYGGRPIDLTGDRSYSLASQSVGVARAIDRPLAFTAFFGRGEAAQQQALRVLQLLRLYRAENPTRITIATLDPYADRAAVDDLLRKVPDAALTRGGGVLIEYGGGESTRRQVVGLGELFEAVAPPEGDDPAAASRFASTFRGESAITSALVRLKSGERPRVAFTTGHGEPSLYDADPGGPGLGLLRSRLIALGHEVVVYNPSSGAVPAGTAMVIVAAPKNPLGRAEADRLREYVDGGGRALVMLDNRGATGLEGWLLARGVGVGPGTVVDPASCYDRRPWLPLAPILGESNHPIVAPLRNEAILMPNAAPLTIGPGDGSGAVAAIVLRSSPRSWAEADPAAEPLAWDREKEAPGPMALGAAVADRPAPGGRPGALGRPRLVVFSSRSMADNDTLAARPANLDLLVNAASWLLDRPDVAGIAPKSHVALTLNADPNLRVKLVVLPTLLAVAVLLGLGVATYLARRD